MLNLPKWKQLDSITFAVLIVPETTLGEYALMYFMRRIPREIRSTFHSLRWDGDFWLEGERWGRIRVSR